MRAENIALGESYDSPLFFAYSLSSLCLKKTPGFGAEPQVVPIIYKGGLMSRTALKVRYFIVGEIR
jgi:hypothetical protein